MTEERGTTAGGRALLVLFALALAVRALYLLEMRGSPFFALPFGGAAFYHAWGASVAAGDAPAEVFYHAPLYPHFLGLVYRLAGVDVAAARALQALLGALACVLVARAGATLVGRRAGLLAGALLALWPQALLFEGVLKKTAFAFFLVCAFLAALAAATRRPGGPRFLVAGILLGLAALVRENTLVLLAVALGWTVRGPSLERAARARAALLLVVGCALPILLVGLRNRGVGGELVLGTTNAGANLYIGNHRDASGLFEPLERGRGLAVHDPVVARASAELAAGRELDAREVSRHWRARAVEEVRAAPGAWLALLARKTWYLLAAQEWVDDHDLASFRGESRLLDLLAIPLRWGALVPLALVGAFLARGRPGGRLLAAASLALGASIVLFFVTERFRTSLTPFLLPLAACALVALHDHLRARRWRPAAGIVAAAAGLGALVHLPTGQEEWPQSSTANYLGLALVAEGRRAEALTWFEHAARLSPENAEASFNAGEQLLELDRPEEATAYLERAAELWPPYLASCSHELGLYHARRGDYGTALGFLQRAAALEPAVARHPYNVGLALRRLGRDQEAEAAYRAALALDPAFADAHNNLGMLLEERGRLEDARSSYEAALRADPAHGRAAENLERVR
jgi:Flp pilus assembly protein TadD